MSENTYSLEVRETFLSRTKNLEAKGRKYRTFDYINTIFKNSLLCGKNK